LTPSTKPFSVSVALRLSILLMTSTRFFVFVQIVAFLFATLVAPAQAATISTAEFLAAQGTAGQRAQQLEQIDRLLASAEVQRQLESLGVSSDDARARVAALSPTELSMLAQRIDSLPAGGSVLGLLGAVFVVLLVLELLGVTDVFSGL
jgi:hypothetical protein